MRLPIDISRCIGAALDKDARWKICEKAETCKRCTALKDGDKHQVVPVAEFLCWGDESRSYYL